MPLGLNKVLTHFIYNLGFEFNQVSSLFLFKFFRFLGSTAGFGGFKLGQTAALLFLPAQLLLTLFFQFVEKVAEIVGLRGQLFNFFLALTLLISTALRILDLR